MDGFGLDDLAEGSEEEREGKRGDEEMGLGRGGIQLARLSGSGRVRSAGEKEGAKLVVKGAGRGE